MDQLLYVTINTVQLFITALMMLLFMRVLLSFFADEGSKLNLFCTIVTEPVVYPVRALLSHIPALEAFPIDMTYMATYLILMLIQSALPVSF